MHVLAVSDAVDPALTDRFDRGRFPKIDLIISCGDLPPEYLTLLVDRFDAPLFYVRGNHDLRYATSPPQGCQDIHGRLVRFRGLTFLGLEGSRWYNGGPYQYTEQEMQAIIRRLRPNLWWQDGADIIVTHAPPRHIHDAEDRPHRGFLCFRQLIARYAPRFFFHGHIHAVFNKAAERMSRVNETLVINSFGHIVAEIDDGRMD